VNEALEMVDEIAVSALVKAQDPIELSNPGKARTRWRRYPWCQATPVADPSRGDNPDLKARQLYDKKKN
jgi:hypothetical protein